MRCRRELDFTFLECASQASLSSLCQTPLSPIPLYSFLYFLSANYHVSIWT